jgi:glycerol-3-phosphate O-acyltransferase
LDPHRSPAAAAARVSAIGRAGRWLRRAALLPVRYEMQPAEPLPSGRICYVLETDRRLDRHVLEDGCARLGWPTPAASREDQRGADLWSLCTLRGWFGRRAVPHDPATLAPFLAAGAGGPAWFVPVAIFFGRAPQRDNFWLKVLLSEDWAFGGRLRRLFAVLVHGRDVLVKVGEPIPAAGAATAGEEGTRRIARLLHVWFDEQRTATVGPDLSHRRLLLGEVLESPVVAAAIRREVRASGRSERRVRGRARRFAREIAADYSYPIVRLLDRVLTWVWNRLYEGVDVRNAGGLAKLATGSELVYVPCHRSHVDYLLLSYVIYRQGLAPPHIAAGVNLNLPIVGAILRRGGAFFIRRSFHGNALYSAVFRSYLRTILSRGFPIEYFIEGTRSRTGRLLAAKTGLLTMTLHSYLLDRQRPVIFVPVYFGYEKVVEGPTYLDELRGARKRKESLGGVVRSLATLRERFGAAYVSFGEPLPLERMLDELRPGWRGEPLDEQSRPDWVGAAADALGRRILVAINEAAVLSPVSLVSLVLLGMPKQAITEAELREQLRLYLELARRAPYAAGSGECGLDAAAIIERCERMRWLTRTSHALGDILAMDERTAVLASYYRNNVVHLFVLPSLIAAAFVNRPELLPARLASIAGELYACIRSELFLRLADADVGAEVSRTAAAMVELGVLDSRAGVLARPPETSARAGQLRLCAEVVQPFVERYFLCVALLQTEGGLRPAELVRRCQAAAEQLAVVYSLDSPDLFTAALFDNFVRHLEDTGVVIEDADGLLTYDAARLAPLQEALGLVLPPRLKQTLLHLAGAAARPLSGDSARPAAAQALVIKRSDRESARSRAE